MTITTDTVSEVEIVFLNGDLDAMGVLETEQKMRDIVNRNDRIAVDCENLSYISSAGLGLFIGLTDLIKQQAGKFVFYNMSEKVKNVFVILGLQNIFKIFETQEEALNYLNQ